MPCSRWNSKSRLLACPSEDRRDGQRIVAGERRIDVRRLEHVGGAGEIGDVGRRLAREQRIIGQPRFLRALDLAVPIGALDQPHRHPPPGRVAERLGPLDRGARALAVGLHRHAVAVPALQRGQARDRADDVEAHLEPLGFLGVDGEPDARAGRRQREFLEPHAQRADALVPARDLVARVQRGELHRDRVALIVRPCPPTGSRRDSSPGSDRRRRACAPPRRACRSSR